MTDAVRVSLRQTKNWPGRLTPKLRTWLKLRLLENRMSIIDAAKVVEDNPDWRIELSFKGHEDDAPARPGTSDSSVWWVSLDYVSGVRHMLGTFDNKTDCTEQCFVAEFLFYTSRETGP